MSRVKQDKVFYSQARRSGILAKSFASQSLNNQLTFFGLLSTQAGVAANSAGACVNSCKSNLLVRDSI